MQTPAGQVHYDGTTHIDGVPGTAAPMAPQFMATVGSVTGAFLPASNLVDTIDDINVTCKDVAMPMVIAHPTIADPGAQCLASCLAEHIR